jgi:hypothetical protein
MCFEVSSETFWQLTTGILNWITVTFVQPWLYLHHVNLFIAHYFRFHVLTVITLWRLLFCGMSKHHPDNVTSHRTAFTLAVIKLLTCNVRLSSDQFPERREATQTVPASIYCVINSTNKVIHKIKWFSRSTHNVMSHIKTLIAYHFHQ